MRLPAGAKSIILSALCLAFAAPHTDAQAKSRPFKREDYERYFSPGNFASFSPFYSSEGLLEVVANRRIEKAGTYVLEQDTAAFDVSVNYDFNSKFEFYKIQSRQADQMMWDEKRGAYIYDYSDREFDADASRVWESADQKTELSKGDKGGGLLHKFYRDVDTRAGRNAKETEAEFRKSVTGLWTWRCAYEVRQGYEVVCTATHEGTQRVETFLYRKLDLVG